MSRFPRCRPAIVAGVLVTLLLPIGAVGCGMTDDEKTVGTTTAAPTTEPEAPSAPVEEWGADVCQALTVWSDGFDKIGEDFDKDLESVEEGDVATVRDLLADLFGQAAEHTHELGDRLEELGAPDIARGEDMATEIRRGISKVQGELTDLKNQVADLAIDDPSTFSDEVDRLNEDFQTALDEISTALDNFEGDYGEDGAKLDEVLNSDDSCADVGA